VADEAAAEREYQDLMANVDEVLKLPVRAPAHEVLLRQSLRYHVKYWLRVRLLRRSPRENSHPLSAYLLRHNIDVIFAIARTEAAITTVPTVMWLPDFQHEHLPDMFQPDDRAGFSAIFRAQAHAANLLLVKSEAVRRDVQAFFPEQAAKVRCIQYVAHVPVESYADDPRDGLARYHLPEKFIYLPNQFWQHKNHKLVFEALAQLRARGVCPCIVSTGNPVDYRRPAYFSELMQLLSEANLREQFIILGQLPRADVFRLMRQAVCVLNPSRFEGFGMSVAESKSLGKRVLVSDLAPLREQAAPGAVYFNPTDAGELAAKMETAWLTWPPGPDRDLEAAARAELPRRQAVFGQALVDLFKEAQADFNSIRPPNRQPA
jgi:glycosyltransferase involved in cell wall biosynthesis